MNDGRVRFGVFEFSPGTGELSRQGSPVKLQAQPARVLAVLVAHPGEVVSRETIQREVWGPAVALLVTLAAVALAWPLWGRLVPSPGTVVVVPFYNETGRPSWTVWRGTSLTSRSSAWPLLNGSRSSA